MNWMKAHPKLIFALIMILVAWGCCVLTMPLIQYAIEGKMMVNASEIAAARCKHQEGIDMVIVGQYVFECESEESHE